MVSEGTFLSGRYRLGEKVAGGGMGTVYRATDEKLGRDVAVKVLAPNLAGDESFVERFRREALAAAGLAHPNIANVFDYGQEDGTHFIVMELAPGRDLSRVLREEGPLPADRVARIVPQICAALGHAHAAGIVHRDIKPGNVIVDERDRVKVTDFGIARAAGDSKLTVTGSVLGTAHYISPEQAAGADLTPASDIYSLGIVTYELLTGAVPYTGESLMSVAMRHVNDEVPPPSAIDPNIPGHLDAIVRRATQKDPKDRYADTEEMAAAFDPATTPSVAGTTAVLGAAGGSGAGTAVLSETEQTVWPIPGNRWDATSLGRKVLLGFAALAVIALALAMWRVATARDEIVTKRDGRQERRSAPVDRSVEPSRGEQRSTIPESVIGLDYREVSALLAAEGAAVEATFLGGEELFAFVESNAIDPKNADPNEVVGTDPAPGESVPAGEKITLYVSNGLDGEGNDDDEDDDEERGPPDHAKGKKDKGKDD